MTAKYIADTIESILSSNEDLLEIAFRQRAKFEGWLKFEIAKEFQKSGKATKVEYPIAKVYADLVADKVLPELYRNTEVERLIQRGHVDLFADNCLIELKTPNTSYTCEGVDSKTRPITKNVNDIIYDINKLRELRNITDKLGELRKNPKGPRYDSFIAFVMFPIDKDEDKNTTSKYMEHVNRIEKHIQAQELKITKAQRIVRIKSIPALVYVAKV